MASKNSVRVLSVVLSVLLNLVFSVYRAIRAEDHQNRRSLSPDRQYRFNWLGQCRRGVDLAVEIINGKYELDLPLARTMQGCRTWEAQKSRLYMPTPRVIRKMACQRPKG